MISVKQVSISVTSDVIAVCKMIWHCNSAYKCQMGLLEQWKNQFFFSAVKNGVSLRARASLWGGTWAGQGERDRLPCGSTRRWSRSRLKYLLTLLSSLSCMLPSLEAEFHWKYTWISKILWAFDMSTLLSPLPHSSPSSLHFNIRNCWIIYQFCLRHDKIWQRVQSWSKSFYNSFRSVVIINFEQRWFSFQLLIKKVSLRVNSRTSWT